jgi:hypothetical protein
MLAEAVCLIILVNAKITQVNCRKSHVVRDIVALICWQFTNAVGTQLQGIIANDIEGGGQIRAKDLKFTAPNGFLALFFRN